MFLSQRDSEESKDISISSFNISESFDGGMPFSNHRAEFISSDVHAVE
jgi:hypothetical protein